MSNQELDAASEAYDKAIDQILDNLTASPEKFTQLLTPFPAICRDYVWALKDAALIEEDEMTKTMHEELANNLNQHLSSFFVHLFRYRQRHGLT